jgi:hypothetical protein
MNDSYIFTQLLLMDLKRRHPYIKNKNHNNTPNYTNNILRSHS